MLSTGGSTTGTLLGVWAHPDDEAYLSAGLMASARAAGQRVAVVTATWGELGTSDPELWPPERLRALRERELFAGLDAVGVTEHWALGFADGSCAHLPEGEGVAAVRQVIDVVRPDTIVTFGPDGMTGHPDHVAVSRWVTAAWQQAGGQAALWYATVTRDWLEAWRAVNDSLGVWMTGPPPGIEAHEVAYELRCDGPVLEAKLAALRAHASQTDPVLDLLGLATFIEWWAVERFRAV